MLIQPGILESFFLAEARGQNVAAAVVLVGPAVDFEKIMAQKNRDFQQSVAVETRAREHLIYIGTVTAKTLGKPCCRVVAALHKTTDFAADVYFRLSRAGGLCVVHKMRNFSVCAAGSPSASRRLLYQKFSKELLVDCKYSKMTPIPRTKVLIDEKSATKSVKNSRQGHRGRLPFCQHCLPQTFLARVLF